jgi:excisionase family DNA binding protein
MATVATRPVPVPRFGSPAAVAAFLGVSTKTVRRLVASESVPSYRLGRRVLVPYRDADQFVRQQQQKRARTMAIAPTISPQSSVDARGRALPLTEAEVRARAEAVARGLEALDAMGDAAEQRETLAYLMTAIDEDRLSDRRRFR